MQMFVRGRKGRMKVVKGYYSSGDGEVGEGGRCLPFSMGLSGRDVEKDDVDAQIE